VITAITKTAMLAVLHSEPKFSELFMSHLLSRNSRIEADLVDQLFNSSEKRLARLLLLLANFGKDGSLQPIKVHVAAFGAGDRRGLRSLTAAAGQYPSAFAGDPYWRTEDFGLIRPLNVLPVVLFTKCSRPQPGQVTAS
jgi:hypothetical protein